MKLPIHLDIEEDTIWTTYNSELKKVETAQALKLFVLRWGNLFSDAIKENWLTEETLANIKAEMDPLHLTFSSLTRINDQTIREMAYLKWEEAGCPLNDGIEYWLEAERELISYTNMVCELILPCKIAYAMLVAKQYVVPLNCAFIQANGGLGEFEE